MAGSSLRTSPCSRTRTREPMWMSTITSRRALGRSRGLHSGEKPVKLSIFINMVFLEMQNKKQFENYLLFPIFATNIFLLWYNLTCFFKSHFSRNLSSQISNAVCYGIFSYASSSRLRKILSRKMIQLRNLCSPSSPMSPWSWRSPWSIMCLQWQQRFSHYWKKRERDTLP